MPLSTLEAMPSSMPEVGNLLIQRESRSAIGMNSHHDEASAGQEFNKHTYSFKADATATDVQTFYAVNSRRWAGRPLLAHKAADKEA